MDLGGLWLGCGIVAIALVGIWFGAPVIDLDQFGLSVNDIELPNRNIGQVELVPAEDAFRARGTDLNPAAFTKFQSSVRTMLRIEVTDPDDPTPYWLISTRNPEALKALIEQNQKRSAQH